MTIQLAEMLVAAIAVYAALGTVFALVFVTVGVRRIDPDARGMPLRARAVVFPGAVGLWPLLLVFMIRGERKT